MTRFDTTPLHPASRPGPFRRVLDGLGLAILVGLGAVLSPELGLLERLESTIVSTPSTTTVFERAATPVPPATSTTSITSDTPPKKATPSREVSRHVEAPLEPEQPRSAGAWRIAWDGILDHLEWSFDRFSRWWTRGMLA